MKLKEYLGALNKLIEQNPEALEMEVIYAKDDDGNGYQRVRLTPAIGYADLLDRYYINSFEVTGEMAEENPNCVCIN